MIDIGAIKQPGIVTQINLLVASAQQHSEQILCARQEPLRD